MSILAALKGFLQDLWEGFTGQNAHHADIARGRDFYNNELSFPGLRLLKVDFSFRDQEHAIYARWGGRCHVMFHVEEDASVTCWVGAGPNSSLMVSLDQFLGTLYHGLSQRRSAAEVRALLLEHHEAILAEFGAAE